MADRSQTQGTRPCQEEWSVTAHGHVFDCRVDRFTERLTLLKHILRLRRKATVVQLQAATTSVDSQLQAKSRLKLAELYKVAQCEEYYMEGQIG